MNPNEIIVQATVGAMVLGVVIAACIWVYRRWGVYRARKQLIRSLRRRFRRRALGRADPDGSGGQLHIDFLLLTGRGLLVVDYRERRGYRFRRRTHAEWP